jgi:hypothetical protein
MHKPMHGSFQRGVTHYPCPKLYQNKSLKVYSFSIAAALFMVVSAGSAL